MASKPALRKPRAATSNLHDGDATQTRERILDATFRRLVSEGYAALSVREIAKDAGVNHALINYHFRSKDQLVIDVLDAVNQRLLSRQASMYESGGGFAQKWAERAALLRGRPRLGLRASAGRTVGGQPVQPRAAREVPAAPAGLEEAGAGCRARGHRRAAGRWQEAAAAVHTRGHRLLDLGVLAGHGIRRPAGREGRAGPAPRGAGCRCVAARIAGRQGRHAGSPSPPSRRRSR